jgi:hypothetical protein
MSCAAYPVPSFRPFRRPSLRVASAATRRVASRPCGVYTPPRWEQIGSTPATIYPSVLVRRCNRSRAPCCIRSLEAPGTAHKRGPAAERRRKGGELRCRPAVATTRARAQLTQVQPRRTTGW